MSWIDLTPGLTNKGKRLPIGKVLVFNFEGSETAIKIVRKYKGKVWGKEVILYRPGEVNVVDKLEK